MMNSSNSNKPEFDDAGTIHEFESVLKSLIPSDCNQGLCNMLFAAGVAEGCRGKVSISSSASQPRASFRWPNFLAGIACGVLTTAIVVFVLLTPQQFAPTATDVAEHQRQKDPQSLKSLVNELPAIQSLDLSSTTAAQVVAGRFNHADSDPDELDTRGLSLVMQQFVQHRESASTSGIDRPSELAEDISSSSSDRRRTLKQLMNEVL